MEQQMREIGLRMQALREACDCPVEELALELGISPGTLREWEETGADVPISALYHMAHKFKVDMTEILTGTNPKLVTYHVTRAGEGLEVDRFEGYHYDDLAFRFQNKLMQPLLVVLEPNGEPASLVTHSGQEFNYVLEGSIVLVFGEQEIILNAGDSVYFNPEHPHGQRCNSTTPAKFLTVIAE